MSDSQLMFEMFVAFVIERHNIYLRRKSGMPKPWTQDPILQSYRFCNIYRELDTVTQWIAKNWRQPNTWEKDVWFMMVIARLVNWPPSLEEYSPNGPKNWRAAWFESALIDRTLRGEKVFTGAYMIHAGPTPGGHKANYLAEEVLTPMWERRAEIRPREGDTLESFHARLMTCKDMGSFMAGQVVCDTKYTQSLARAKDWHTWAAMGPGSARGMNRVLGLDPKSKWARSKHSSDDRWLSHLIALRTRLNARLPKSWEKLHAQDVQNCLCEFDKYMRVYNGEGRPRSLYPGKD